MGTTSEYNQGPEKREVTDVEPSLNTNNFDSDVKPPIYYNSEPSAQPPRYPVKRTTSSNEPQTTPTSQPLKSKPTYQKGTGAPSSTIAAVLSSGYVDLDAQRRADRKKKTLHERWNDFKGRNFSSYDVSEDKAGAGSAPEWNVQGGRLSGGLASPYRKKQGK